MFCAQVEQRDERSGMLFTGALLYMSFQVIYERL